jgi:hypothetical protein
MIGKAMQQLSQRQARRVSTEIARQLEARPVNRTPDLAGSGWVVEADLAKSGELPDRRYFAVGLATAEEAVDAVLIYPGMLREDRRVAIRPLSPEEISSLKVRPHAVRPYPHVAKERAVKTGRG